MLPMTSAAFSDTQPTSSAGTGSQLHPRPAKAPPPARPTARRLVLVPAAPSGGRDDELVRRYRLARLRLEPREVRGDERFAHLKRAYD
jgi:hypothetical protein